MSSIDTAIGELLDNSAGVTALVSTRIYQPPVPQKDATPYLAFFIVDDLPKHAMGSTLSLRDCNFQVDCWADTAAEAAALALQVEAALDNYSGTSDGVVIRNCFSTNAQPFPYDPDEGIFRYMLEFSIQYVRP